MSERHDPDVAARAVRPSTEDLAIAEEVVLGALAAGATLAREELIARVQDRLAQEPLPEPFQELDDVTETDCRRCWGKATALTALATLQWSGQLLPCDVMDTEHSGLHLSWSSPRGGGPLRNFSSACAFPIARQLRIAPWITAIGTTTVAALRQPLRGAGAKVVRLLQEAAESYLRREYVAAAILLGVASEAA